MATMPGSATCLQVQMSKDSVEYGYFLSALASFVTRTCYANAGGERHWLSSRCFGHTLLCCTTEC